MSSPVSQNFNPVRLVGLPTVASEAASKAYVDTSLVSRLPLIGGTLSGPVFYSGAFPVNTNQLVTKAYVDWKFSTVSNNSEVNLRGWVESGAVKMTAPVYSSTGALISSPVYWPDTSAGTFTVTYWNSAAASVDGFVVTHNNTGTTITQPRVTRNSIGLVTINPLLVFS